MVDSLAQGLLLAAGAGLILFFVGLAIAATRAGKRQQQQRPHHRTPIYSPPPLSGSGLGARRPDSSPLPPFEPRPPPRPMTEAARHPLPPQSELNAVVRQSREMLARPTASQQTELRQHWEKLRDHVIRLSHEASEGHPPSPHLELAGSAVLSGLGACAACDITYHDFQEDRALASGIQQERQQRQSLLAKIISLRNDARKVIADIQYLRASRFGTDFLDLELLGKPLDIATPGIINKLMHDLYQRLGQIRWEMEQLASRIKALDASIEKEEHRIAEQLSSGYVLLGILRDGQKYPIAVRQGAAWGLHLLRAKGHLNPPERQEILEAIQGVVTGDGARDYCERRVQLLPDSPLPEFCEMLQDGLAWMETIADGPYARATDVADGTTGPEASPGLGDPNQTILARYPLETVVAALDRTMPKLLDFLREYPLRLMRRDHQRDVLGEYVRLGCALELWTRYSPPKDLGPVHNRYLGVDDRSTPNSMGICYQLFRHHLLALPVIYHEFLHYGGPEGTSAPIENEAEVWLREIIFARGQIALAADGDKGLAIEQQLIRTAQQEQLSGVIAKFVAIDPRCPDALDRINALVEAIYGRRRSTNEAEQAAKAHLEKENVGIDLHNATQTWCPHVPWPRLGTPETVAVTSAFEQILVRHWTRENRITPAQFADVLAEARNRSWLAAWDQYVASRGGQHLTNLCQQRLPGASEGSLPTLASLAAALDIPLSALCAGQETDETAKIAELAAKLHHLQQLRAQLDELKRLRGIGPQS